MLQPRRWMAMMLMAGLVGASLALPAPVSAALLRVGPGGFATIQQAINNAGPETVISIEPGSYPENIDLATMGSAVGSGTSDLVLVAADGPGTVNLGGSGVKVSSSAVFEGTLVLDGLNISSTDEDAIRLNSFTNLVIADNVFGSVGNDDEDNAIEVALTTGAPHIVVFNNSFGASPAPGADLGSAVRIDSIGSSNPIVTIQDNTVTQPTIVPLSFPRFLLAMLGTGATVSIRENSLSNVSSTGIFVSMAGAGDKTLTIRDNTLTTMRSVGIDVVATRGGAVDTAILNNRIVDSGASAIELDTEDDVTARIAGNEITNTGGNGIDAGSRGRVPEPVPVQLSIENNNVTNAQRNGIQLLGGGAGMVMALVRNNRIQQPAASGVALFSGLAGSSSSTGTLSIAATANTVGADTLGRSVLLVEGDTSLTQVEGDAAETVQQNVAADNTLAGTVLADSDVNVAARGAIQPIAEPLKLTVVDDQDSAVPQLAEEIDVLANDENGAAASLPFVVPLSSNDGFVAADDTVNYTSAAGFTGVDEVLYVARLGNVTGVGRVTISIRQPLGRTPRNLRELYYMPQVSR